MLHLLPALLAATALGAPLRAPAPEGPAAGPAATVQLTGVQLGGAVSFTGMTGRQRVVTPAAAPVAFAVAAPARVTAGADVRTPPPWSSAALPPAAVALLGPRPPRAGPVLRPAGLATQPWHRDPVWRPG